MTTVALLAGCVAQDTNTGVPDVVVEAVVPEETPQTPEPEPEIVADPVPGACEVLLARLEETHPLLSNLDEALAGQAERIEKAVARANRPASPPPVQECPKPSTTVLGKKEIIGSIEWIYMDPPGKHYRARVDSGAETSSLSASQVVEFERDGDDWVRFTFENDDAHDAINFELPIKRAVLIRQASSDVAERRVVVELDIRLGNQLQATEFTLTDRSSMTFPVLIGRAFLMDYYVVDVARSFTHKRFEVPES